MTRISGRRGIGGPRPATAIGGASGVGGVGGADGASGAGGVGAREQNRPSAQREAAPAPAPPPAPRRRADDFDAVAAPPRRREASPLASLIDFPFEQLVAIALGRASGRLDGARIQHLEVAVVSGEPTLKVSFHDERLVHWYAVRLSHSGEVLWEGHELTRSGSKPPSWPTVEDLGSLAIGFHDVLAWIRAELPDARFDFVGLQVREFGRLVWVAGNTQAFEADPVLEVDGTDGETQLLRFDRAAGRHVPG